MADLKILLLEDSPIDAELIRQRLESGGLTGTVRHVATGAAFRDALKDCEYDLILSDYELPDTDGTVALKDSLAHCPDTPFIYVSGKLGEDAAVQSLQEGATDYVVKHRLDRLLPAMRRAVHEASERRKRVAAEAALRETEQRLRETLQHTVEVERSARLEAEHVSRMKDEFLATLSHELRTPLNAILGWSQLIQRKADGHEELLDGLRIIERNARAQARLIEDLLDMSRIISGKVLLNIDPCDIGLVTHAAIEIATPAAEARQIRIETKIDPGAGWVMGDASRLQQVLWNLLSNAVKFTPPGGTVTVSIKRIDGSVAVTVADTGNGIAPEFLPHVFERFRQADSSVTRSVGGLGLGLSIVKHLVEVHGGTVSASSAGEGKGSAFTVALPAAEARNISSSLLAGGIDRPRGGAIDVPASAAQPRPALAGVRIVVVDDEVDARVMLQKAFEGEGATVRIAGSAEEGRALIAAARPQVVLSDIGMPGEDGYSFIESLGATRSSQAMVAIALTAFARPTDRARALAAGFDAHVSKPIDCDAVIALVSKLLGQRQTQNQQR